MVTSKSRFSFTPVSTSVLLLLSCLLLPALAYLGGRVVVGPYEGSFGLLGYLGSVFGDALRGSWLAWVLLLAPAATVSLWGLIRKVTRKYS